MSEFKDSAQKTTVRKVWRNEFKGGHYHNFDNIVDAQYSAHMNFGEGEYLRVAVPFTISETITITETEGHKP